MKPFKTECNERKQALMAHRARETQAAVDAIRGKRQHFAITREAARDKSNRLN